MRTSKYTKERLAPLVKISRNITQVIRRLGITPNGGNHRYISMRVRFLRLNTSHFKAETIKARITLVSDPKLARLVREHTSVAQIAKALGFQDNGRAHYILSERIRASGLDLSHFPGRAWSRGQTKNTHPTLKAASERYRVPDSKVFVANSSYGKGKQIVERLIEKGWPYQCSVCGITEWNGGPLVLHLDHINGIHNDNRYKNLRFLCPNCHSQTSTYCRRRG